MATTVRQRRLPTRPPASRFIGSRIYGWKTTVVKVWTRV